MLSARFDHTPNRRKKSHPRGDRCSNFKIEEFGPLFRDEKQRFLEGRPSPSFVVHVPPTLSKTMRGSSVPIRFSFVSDIMSKIGFPLSLAEAKSSFEFLKRYCPKCLSSSVALGDILWSLTGDNGCHFTKFITSLVESCLKCEERLQMHNNPTKAIVHGSMGPLPASKITLECKECITTYGIGHFTDESGALIYPRGIQSPFIEASNVSYMNRDFYKWIPSLG